MLVNRLKHRLGILEDQASESSLFLSHAFQDEAKHLRVMSDKADLGLSQIPVWIYAC